MTRTLRMVLAAAALVGGLLFTRPADCLDLFTLEEASPPRIIDEGILFTYKPEKREPRYVMVSGEFDNWREPHLMEKNQNGVYLFVYSRTDERGMLVDSGRYRYRFLVDGFWLPDPSHSRVVHDRHGEALSTFQVAEPVYRVHENPYQVAEDTYVFYYLDGVARYVRLVGDFNNWNPYSLPMKKNAAGIWEIEVFIPPGEHYYRFYIDGKYRNDPLGKFTAVDRFDNEYTMVRLPFQKPLQELLKKTPGTISIRLK